MDFRCNDVSTRCPFYELASVNWVSAKWRSTKSPDTVSVYIRIYSVYHYTPHINPVYLAYISLYIIFPMEKKFRDLSEIYSQCPDNVRNLLCFGTISGHCVFSHFGTFSGHSFVIGARARINQKKTRFVIIFYKYQHIYKYLTSGICEIVLKISLTR